MSRARWILAGFTLLLVIWFGVSIGRRRIETPYVNPNDPAPGAQPRPGRPDAGPRPDAAPASPAVGAASAASAADLVDVTEVVPGLVLDVRYATDKNFLGRAVYPKDHRVRLVRDAAERLARVQRGLQREGLGLVIFDGYRPLSVQREMWALMPDERYVADPQKGSRHNRGAAVDVSLVDRAGRPLPMPTDYDDFTPTAAADAPSGTPEQRANRARLRAAMEAEGFTVMPTEWWHFDAPGWEQFPIRDH